MKKILIITNAGSHTGIGNLTDHLYEYIQKQIPETRRFIVANRESHTKGTIKDDHVYHDYNTIGIFHTYPRAVKAYIRAHHFDYVLLGNQTLGYLIRPIQRMGIPVGIIFYDTFLSTMYPYNPFVQLIKYIAVNRSIEAKQVFFISHETQRQFFEVFPMHRGYTHTIYPGIDFTQMETVTESKSELRRRYGIPEDMRVAINIATDLAHKNNRTYYAIAGRMPDVLFLKGGGAIGTEHEKFLTDHGITNVRAIAAHNRLDRRTLLEYMKLSDIYVNTSIAEGFGYPPVETYALGGSVVSSRLPSLVEVFGDGARWVDDFYDTDAYVRAIHAAFETPLPRISLDFLHWESIAAEYLQSIETCV